MFCNKNCKFLDKEEDKCIKFSNQILPRNIYHEIFKCKECITEELKNESKN